MIAWQISEIDRKWMLKPRGGPTPDLVNAQGEGIQVKATSDRLIKGNKVSPSQGYFIVVKYTGENFSIKIGEILMGELKSGQDRIEHNGLY